MDFDFAGWATKNDIRCEDGRIIRKDAFKSNDGKRVPLMWGHEHGSVTSVLGHAILENRDEGVYAYCKLNDSPGGQAAKAALKNGDIESLSIWANNLHERGKDVLHGVIREVSLVVAGSNPGAFVESVLAHSMPMEEGDEEAIIYSGEPIVIAHAAPIDDVDTQKAKDDGDAGKDETVQEVFNTLTDKQKSAVAIIIGQAVADANEELEEGDDEMKHHIFEPQEERTGAVLSHSDFQKLMDDVRSTGRLSLAIKMNMQEGGVLAHAIPTDGMNLLPDGGTVSQTYGVRDLDMLYPDYRTMDVPPIFISRDMDWVSKLMNAVHKTPFSRIKSLFADITEDEARARGYIKGNLKKEEVFTLLGRTTDPQTVYKKQAIDKDDLIEITSFDVIAWLKNEMRMMWLEEIARAILIGDGRNSYDPDKIKEDHIRPIASDADLFTVKIKVTVSSNADAEEIAKAAIKEIIKSRKQYKGSGTPMFWTTDDLISDMLLLEDAIDHRLYTTENDLATALRVREIVPVEPMVGTEIEISSKKYPLLGIIFNPADYNVGTNPKGNPEMINQFDIDYNKEKYLYEGRQSGALIKPFSAIAIVLDKTGAGG